MIRVEFHPDVAQDLVDTTSWYDDQEPGLGGEFRREVARVIEVIRERPDTWPLLSGQTRRCLLDRFPYGIFYTHEEEVVYVQAVMHLRRRPGSWKHRHR